MLKKIVYFLTFMAIAFGISASALPPTPAPEANMSQQVWNLKDADIRAIIQTVSMMTGKNFIVDPRVQGKVTFISHKPMSSDELYNAFLSMLQILNFVAVQSDGVTKIVPSVDANSINSTFATRQHPGSGDSLVVRVIPVNNVSATQLIPVLRPLMPQWSNVTAYAPANSLILASTAANIKHLEGIIQDMDSKTTNQTAIVSLQNANAENVVDVINKLEASDRAIGRTPNISVAADTLSNSILISGNLNNISTMKALISQMDHRAKTDNNLAKVLFLNYLSAKKLAPILNKVVQGQTESKKGATITKSDVSVQAEPDNDNALIVHAPRNLMQEVESIVRRLDTKPQQVLVEAIIVKMDESLLKQLGIVWGTVNGDAESTAVQRDITPHQVTGANSFALKVNSHGVGFIADGSLQALIHALQSRGSSDILSTPSIVVLNGQKATISDGKNVGIVNREYDNSNAINTNGDQNLGVPFNTIERKDVALSLTVTPQISPNRMLRMKIEQKDDSLSQTNTASTVANDNPTIDTSKITTNVMVKSGDILVLGGLIDHQALKNDSKIPILGSIPLIGNLFKYTNHHIEKKDLMVFLKPIILNSDYRRRKETMTRYHRIRREELAARAGENSIKNGDDVPILPNPTQYPTRPTVGLPAPTDTYLGKRRRHG